MATDGKRIFAALCRIPGTRCDRIMQMIADGHDDATIAALYDRGPLCPCTPEDIAVYRAQYNKLHEEDRHVRAINQSSVRG